MEHLLNLMWLFVVAILFLAAVCAQQRNQLRCSLAVALGCTAILTLVLFPALSMTDDLQCAHLDVESSARSLSNTLLLGSLHGVQLQFVGISSVLLLLLAIRFCGSAGLLVRTALVLPRGRLSGTRPEAVRPPPVFCF